METETKKPKACANCRYYAPEEQVCVNDESIWCADFRVPEQNCVEWTAKEGA